MNLLRRYSNNILSLLKRESINVPVGLSILLVLLLILPFAYSIVYNEIHLKLLEKRTERYSHPPDSQLMEKVSLIGNFAPASNQCGFIAAEVRTTMLKPDDIRAFYAPILTTLSYDGNPPYHNVTLFILMDEKDTKDFELFYPDVYERITYRVMDDTSVYLLLTSETGYPPNYDIRCH